jgi:luciferase family oxidoreductase group 1
MPLLSVLDQSPISDGATPAQAIHQTIELAKLTDRLGYHRYWMAEHHSSDGLGGSAPEILAARVAGDTRGIRVGTGGVMLSHYSPLKVAETFRVLETLYPGRIDLGIGRAPGSDQRTASVLAYGNPPRGPREYPGQVRDLIDFLHGDLPADHHFAGLQASPLGEGMPEIWMLGSSDQSAQMAAYFGTPFSFAHFITDEGGTEVMQEYRDGYRPSADHPTARGNIGAFVICAETEAEAQRLALSRDLWRTRLDTGHIGPVPTIEEAAGYDYSPVETQRRDYHRRRNIIGDPDQVKRGLEDLMARYGIDEVVIVTITHDDEARRRSYELIAEAFGLAVRE